MTSFDPIFASHGSSHQDEKMRPPEMMAKPELFEQDKMMGQHHMSYRGMCAPGFAPLDELCVLDDRCGPGAYAGKVCIMDGVMKQYLRPLHQKHAGISVDDIICAEGKQLLFKSRDATPICANSKSVEKLTQRGWQSEKPPIACDADYTPICGVDGITYGNMCTLNAQHMAMKYNGECKEPSLKTTVLYVDSKLVDCVGVGPQQCMLIKEDLDSEWQMFYDVIEGFDYQEGTQYKLSVTITEIENPPADSSSLEYTLVEVLEP